MNNPAVPARAESSECPRTDDQTLSNYCRVLRDSSIGSGWKHLADVLAELEGLRNSLPRRLAHVLSRHDRASEARKVQQDNL